MKTLDCEGRYPYGSAWIREHPERLQKFPLGPVHWDVWGRHKDLLREAVPAEERLGYLVSLNLLVQW